MKFREEKEDHIMSSMKKRILALVLALVMCVGMLPTGVFATETDLGEEPGVVADISTEAPNQTDTALEETGTETESDNETEPEAIDINSGTVPEGTVIDPAQPEQTGEPEAAPAATAPAEAETQEPGESPAPAESTEGSYTVEDFMAAIEAFGDVMDEDENNAALDKCDDIYASLSKEDQAAMAEHYAALQAYRADPNDGVETLDYTSYTSHITLGAGDGSPTGMKMSVGDHWYGHWYVESISLSSVKFGSKYGEHNNSNFKVPAPEDIWEGVSSNYKTVAGYSTAWNGNANIGSFPLIIYTAGSAKYINVINLPTPTPTTAPTPTPTAPAGAYVSVVHNYYTNGSFTGSWSENVSVYVPTYNVPATHQANSFAKTTYNGNTYSYTSGSPAAISVSKGATGYQGTFNLTYNRETVETKLIFNTNANGDSVSNMPSGVTYNNVPTTSSTVATIENKTPTRDGYVFTGWNTAQDGSGRTYQPGDGIKLNGGTTTRLYAQWEEAKPVATENLTLEKTFVGLDEIPTDFSIVWKETHAETGDVVTKTLTVNNASSIDDDAKTLTWSVPHYYKSGTNALKHQVEVTENCTVDGYDYEMTVTPSFWTVNGNTATRTIGGATTTTTKITNTYTKNQVKTSIQTVTLGVHFTKDTKAGSTVMPALSDIPTDFALKYSYTDADGKHEGTLNYGDAKQWLDGTAGNCPTLTWENSPLKVKVAEGTPVYIELEESNYLIGDNESEFIWTRSYTADGGKIEEGTGQVKVTYASWDRNMKNNSYNYYKQPEPKPETHEVNFVVYKAFSGDELTEKAVFANEETKEPRVKYTYTISHLDGYGEYFEPIEGTMDWEYIGTQTPEGKTGVAAYKYSATVEIPADAAWFQYLIDEPNKDTIPGYEWYYNNTAWCQSGATNYTTGKTITTDYVNYYKKVKPGKPTDPELFGLKLGVELVCDTTSEHGAKAFTMTSGVGDAFTVGSVTENTVEATKEAYPYTCTVSITVPQQQNFWLGQYMADGTTAWNKEHQLTAGKKTLTATLYHDGEKWTLPMDNGMNSDVQKVGEWNYLVIHTVHIPGPVKPEPKYAIQVDKQLVLTEAQKANGVKNGDVVSYTVTVTNVGTADIYDLTIDDTMDPGLSLKELTGAALNGKAVTLTKLSSSKNETTNKTTTTWGTLPEFKVDDVVTITYTATVSNTGKAQITLHNVAHALGYETAVEQQAGEKSVAKMSAVMTQVSFNGGAGRTPVEGWSTGKVPTEGSGTTVVVGPTPSKTIPVALGIRFRSLNETDKMPTINDVPNTYQLVCTYTDLDGEHTKTLYYSSGKLVLDENGIPELSWPNAFTLAVAEDSVEPVVITVQQNNYLIGDNDDFIWDHWQCQGGGNSTTSAGTFKVNVEESKKSEVWGDNYYTQSGTQNPPVTGEYKVTVKYVDEAGNAIAADVTVNTTDNGKYNVTDKKVAIDGYNFKEVQDNKALEGTVTEDTVITLVYNRNSTPTNPGSNNDDDDDDGRPTPTPTPGPSRDPEPTPSTTPKPSPAPVEDLPEEQVPLTGLPEGLEEDMIPDEVPLADLPPEEELEELLEGDAVPLANVPETGDKAPIWGVAAGISGAALLFLTKRKKEEEEA